ncbi:MAG TPA: hypothetical protein VIJ34_08795, partial [Acidimicrobiales bacterium]
RRAAGSRAPVALWLPALTGELRLVDQEEMDQDEIDQRESTGQAVGEVALARHPEPVQSRRAASQ